MKQLKRIIPMLLACTCLFSACVQKPTQNNSSSNGNNTSSSDVGLGLPDTDKEIEGIWKDNQNVVVNNGAFETTPVNPQKPAEEHFQTKNVLHKVNVKETNKPFVVNKKTEYKILVPASRDARIITAANFLIKQIKNATGCQIMIESGDSYTWDENAKWIVLGRTELFQAAGLTMPADELGVSGYYIKTVGNSAFIEVEHEYAWQKAILTLLDHLVGYEFYWTDTIVFEKNGETFPEMDIIERPDFDYYMESNIYPGDGRYAIGSNDNIWITVEGHSMHNTFYYFPKAEYATEHSEWYSLDGTQLCYTARGNKDEYRMMVEEMAEKVCYWANLAPELSDISITHEDGNSWCSCNACMQVIKAYNNSNVAVLIKFVNDVDDLVQARLQAEAEASGTKKRDLRIFFFSYRKTEVPPVKKNADGTYSAIDEEVVCNPNVGVYIAPIMADYDVSFYHVDNEYDSNNIRGWASICQNIYMWIYDTNFHEYMFPLNTWDSKIETYRFLKEQGANFIYSQSQTNQGAITHFSRFKDYIDTKVTFDVNVNYNDLKDAFFTNYYGPAVAPMRQFFDELQSYMEYLSVKYPSVVMGNYKERIGMQYLWPKKILKGYLDLVEQAYQCLEPLKESQPQMYDIYKEHVLLESIFPRFALLEFYSGTYTTEEFAKEAKQFKQDCMDLKITMKTEVTPLADTWKKWGI